MFKYCIIMAVSIDAFGIFEVAYVSVLAVVFILLAFVCHRKTWMWCGMTLMFVCGVAYVAVPAHMLKFQVSYRV